MKFEYNLKYDFVSKHLSFEIINMPEDFKGRGTIVKITSEKGTMWEIKSRLYPEISKECRTIYLKGNWSKDSANVECESYELAAEIADVLEKFQQWVEDRKEETVMTIAEIEKKLGIKNLKIVKENK